MNGRRLTRWAGAALLLALALGAGLGPLLLPDPAALDLLDRFAAPSLAHPFGTDELGRDVAARLAMGGRVSLAVAAATALMSALIGTTLGLLAGYHGGRIDAVLMRLADTVMALPLLPLLIILAAADLGRLGLPSASTESPLAAVARLVAIIACVGWPGVARLVRTATLSVRTRDHVRAARALGVGSASIMIRHILPEIVAPVVVATTLAVGTVILIESALSFLGLGIRPPLASWGNMLTGAMEAVWTAPRLAVGPGVMILLAVLGFTLLGEGAGRPPSSNKG
jgi:peptide/nickel transport system permease protein